MCIAWFAVFGTSYLLLYHFLSMCGNCGNGEGAHTPAQHAGIFFSCGSGLLTVMRKNQPVVPRSNFGEKGSIHTARALRQVFEQLP